jgi:hypothetical protein
MADRAKKASILKIIKNEEVSIVPEVKTAVRKSKQSSIKDKEKKSEKVDSSIDDKQPLAQEQVKKILPPIPTRTSEEWQFAISNYEQELKSSLPQRIPAVAGTVADNITEKGYEILYPRQVRRISKSIIERLLSDPSIIAPTWEVLIDNALSIMEKSRQLQAIGWELEIIPVKGFREMCLLARILRNGVD